ncbi:hypothetical protein SAMN02745163_02356 [Clostridium cavendishii DSM 21758]|uniref:Uncharacterized protein n=1 Tax=Clostridium cavendishii DSM 21758 TaxID=1121302 RepID=A0A1M6L112_9CLOT|nr:hypothetical protein [Clostridium cavendishii]SHJ64839.1 hypothetical protein SAMN02745163_02356 [Clostridium cavendishii DSM 21758]
MANIFDVFIYLDEGLIKNLCSSMLEGYIEIRTSKVTYDRALTGRVHLENRQQLFGEERSARDEREGYKGKNTSEACSNQQSVDRDTGVEQRDCERVEEEVKKIYTIFTFHNRILDVLSNNNMLTRPSESQLINSNIIVGSFIEVTGTITTTSVLSYLDIIIDIINCYGEEYLNSLIKEDFKGNMNFSSILNMEKRLRDILALNGTQDLIVVKGNTIIILTVNTKFFMNNDAYIYDKVNCNCKIMGKVLSVSKNISLFRKASSYEYYEKLIASFEPLMKALESKGIIVPKMPRIRLEGNIVELLPISICV